MNCPALPSLAANLSSTMNIGCLAPGATGPPRSCASWRALLALAGTRGARLEPPAHFVNLVPDEGIVVKGVGQRGDALAAGKKMHCERIGVGHAAEQRELPAQPDPE